MVGFHSFPHPPLLIGPFGPYDLVFYTLSLREKFLSYLSPPSFRVFRVPHLLKRTNCLPLSMRPVFLKFSLLLLDYVAHFL